MENDRETMLFRISCLSWQVPKIVQEFGEVLNNQSMISQESIIECLDLFQEQDIIELITEASFENQPLGRERINLTNPPSPAAVTQFYKKMVIGRNL